MSQVSCSACPANRAAKCTSASTAATASARTPTPLPPRADRPSLARRARARRASSTPPPRPSPASDARSRRIRASASARNARRPATACRRAREHLQPQPAGARPEPLAAHGPELDSTPRSLPRLRRYRPARPAADLSRAPGPQPPPPRPSAPDQAPAAPPPGRGPSPRPAPWRMASRSSASSQRARPASPVLVCQARTGLLPPTPSAQSGQRGRCPVLLPGRGQRPGPVGASAASRYRERPSGPTTARSAASSPTQPQHCGCRVLPGRRLGDLQGEQPGEHRRRPRRPPGSGLIEQLVAARLHVAASDRCRDAARRSAQASGSKSIVEAGTAASLFLAPPPAPPPARSPAAARPPGRRLGHHGSRSSRRGGPRVGACGPQVEQNSRTACEPLRAPVCPPGRAGQRPQPYRPARPRPWLPAGRRAPARHQPLPDDPGAQLPRRLADQVFAGLQRQQHALAAPRPFFGRVRIDGPSSAPFVRYQRIGRVRSGGRGVEGSPSRGQVVEGVEVVEAVAWRQLGTVTTDSARTGGHGSRFNRTARQARWPPDERRRFPAAGFPAHVRTRLAEKRTPGSTTTTAGWCLSSAAVEPAPRSVTRPSHQARPCLQPSNKGIRYCACSNRRGGEQRSRPR